MVLCILWETPSLNNQELGVCDCVYCLSIIRISIILELKPDEQTIKRTLGDEIDI
jgi:hypothetical protein